MTNPSAETVGEGFAFLHWHIKTRWLYGCHSLGHWGCIHYWRMCQLDGRKPV
jgi:hypothetical protein